VDIAVKGDQIPDADEVLRHCRSTDWSSDGRTEKVSGEAFIPDTDGVSVTWVQFFPGRRDEQLRAARAAIASGLKIRQSHRFAVIGVGEVVHTGRQRGVQLNVAHDPLQVGAIRNDAHCLILGIPIDDAMLLEALARKVQIVQIA
jgi:hypothetical protein